MTRIRQLIPLKLLIAAAVLFGLSFAVRPMLDALVPDLQTSSDVLVIAIPFLMVFVPIILIVGHLFNLVISVLGSFIHSGRLQFVEFFTKFFEGGGKPFKPLTRVTENVSISD